MNICFVVPNYPEANGNTSSGVGRASYILAHGLYAIGHTVSVITLSRDHPHVELDGGIAVHRVRSGNIHWYFNKLPFIGKYWGLAVREIEYSWNLFKCLKRLHSLKPFDVIEGTETGSLFLNCLRSPSLVIRLHGELAAFRSQKSVSRSELWAAKLSRQLQIISLQRANKLISPSHFHATQILKEIPWAKPKLSVIPHALPIITDSSIPYSESIPQATVLFVGRLELGKGILDALQSFAVIKEKFENVQLIVIGAPHPTIESSLIQNTVEKYRLTKHVFFQGALPYQDVLKWYRKAHIFLMPSYYETFGLVVLEAMHAGIPTVAYASGALPELLGDNEAGILVSTGDIEALSRALIELLSNPTLIHEIGKKAIQKAKTFSIQSYIERTLDIYNAALTEVRQY